MSKITPQSVFKQTSALHLTISIFTTLIVGICYTLRMQVNGGVEPRTMLNIFELLVPVMAIASFAAAYYVGKNRYKKLNSSANLIDKMNVYRGNNLLIWSSLTGSAFFAGISFYITGQNNLLLFGLMTGVMLLYFRPLKSRAKEELNLNEKESDLLDQTV